MAGGWPIYLDVCNGKDSGTVLTTSLGTVITASSTANTKGSYTQLVASTAYDACFMMVTISAPSTANAINSKAELIDIATGASGSEIVLVPNLIFPAYSYTTIYGVSYGFPCCIPAGTRIAARSQSGLASNTSGVQVTLFDGSFSQPEGFGIVDSYGPSTSTSLGTPAIASGTADAKGSYAQLTASTSHDLAGVMVALDTQNATLNNTAFLVDIAIGASGSEVVIVPNIMVCCGSGWLSPPVTPFIPVNIPAGTRIAARVQSNVASATAGVSLYGVRR